MAEEVLDPQAVAPDEGLETKPRKGKMKMIIIIAVILIISLASGFAAYTMFIGKKGASGAAAHDKAAKEPGKVTLLALDPMVLNLAEPNRFLKLSMQLELSDASSQQLASDRVPQLRDAIIILASSKSYASIMTPEGKFQLKDEMLLRANQAVGKDIFKNLYFTEFVTQ